MVDGLPDPAVVLDARGEVLHANRLADQLFGASRPGRPLVSLSRDPDLLAAVDNALATRQGSVAEMHARVPLERRLLASIAPLSHVGAPTDAPALLVSFRDSTEQDRLARMRADFVANASHELRTPLASLKGFIDTLQGAARDDAEARARFLAIMSEQAERMTRLIDDLLSLSRIEMREHVPPADKVDLNEALARVVEGMQPLARQRGAQLTLVELEGPALVRGDHDELVQLFQNLVQNAIKYGRQDGTVTVRIARRTGPTRVDQLLVSVQDNGPGIAPQHLPRLTERFYRISVATSRAQGGTGLGLAIVKHILNRHSGSLSVESTLGEGSTFTVQLPAIVH
jgi:two-component system phosphate regulon sensor histidine kinase PhoR